MSTRGAPRRLRGELTEFVGRRTELALIRQALGTARLVTLTGPGGIGKTRLAIEAALGARRAFRDGVWLAELGGLRDPALLPSAAKLPCIAARPSGWTAGAADISNGRAPFWLDSDQAGPRAVTITLTPACGTSGAIRVPSDQPGAARFERPLSLQPRFTLVRMYTFPGGCITYQFSFIPGAAPSLAIPIDTAIAFEPRTVLAGHVQRKEDLALCGRGAPCP